jgi:hypothetical protein
VLEVGRRHPKHRKDDARWQLHRHFLHELAFTPRHDFVQDARGERPHHGLASPHRCRAERRLDQRPEYAVARGVHESKAFLLLEQQLGWEVIQQRTMVAAEQRRRLQHMIDVALLQKQPVPTGGEAVVLPQDSVRLPQFRHYCPRGAGGEPVEVKQWLEGTLGHVLSLPN